MFANTCLSSPPIPKNKCAALDEKLANNINVATCRWSCRSMRRCSMGCHVIAKCAGAVYQLAVKQTRSSRNGLSRLASTVAATIWLLSYPGQPYSRAYFRT